MKQAIATFAPAFLLFMIIIFIIKNKKADSLKKPTFLILYHVLKNRFNHQISNI